MVNIKQYLKNNIIPGGSFLVSTILGLIFWYFNPDTRISISAITIVIFGCILFFLLVNYIYSFIKSTNILKKEEKYSSSKKVIENFYKFIITKEYKKAWEMLDEKQYLKEKYTYEEFLSGFKHMKSIHNLKIDIVSYNDPLRHVFYVLYIDEFDLPIIDNFRIIETRLIDLYHELKKISKTEFFKIISDIPLRYFFLPNRDEFLTFTYPKLQKYIVNYRTKEILRGYEITLIRKNKKTRNWKILKLHEISPLMNY